MTLKAKLWRLKQSLNYQCLCLTKTLLSDAIAINYHTTWNSFCYATNLKNCPKLLKGHQWLGQILLAVLWLTKNSKIHEAINYIYLYTKRYLSWTNIFAIEHWKWYSLFFWRYNKNIWWHFFSSYNICLFLMSQHPRIFL